jgi:hypothetical protein
VADAFDWQAVLAKGKPAGYINGPIITDKHTEMTPQLRATLDYNKALRYQQSAQRLQEAAQQYGVSTSELRGTPVGYIPKDTSKIQLSAAARNDTSGFVIGPINEPNMKAYYDKNPPASGTVGLATRGPGGGAGSLSIPTGALTGGGTAGGGGTTGGGAATGGGGGAASGSGGLIAGAAGAGTSAATERAALERAQLERWNVTAPQTVQGQLDGLLARGNPLFERARTQTMQAANDRGILNSTMAAEAGQAAMLDRALDIARPDAATNAAAGQFNAGAANNMAQFNAGAANDTSRFNAGQANQMASDNANRNLDWAKTNYNGQLQKALAQMDIDSKRELTILDGQIKKDLAKVEADFKTAMQTSQSAAGLYSDAIRSITTIMVDPKLDAGAKQNLTNQLIGSVTNGLRLINAVGEVEGLDEILADIRNFGGSTTGSATSGGTTGGTTGGSTGGGGYGGIDYNAPGYAP